MFDAKDNMMLIQCSRLHGLKKNQNTMNEMGERTHCFVDSLFYRFQIIVEILNVIIFDGCDCDHFIAQMRASNVQSIEFNGSSWSSQ